MNVVQNALSSRRANRWLLVVGALVLAAGVIAILATKLGGNSSSGSKANNANPTGPAISDVAKAQKDIRFPPAAWNVVKQFVFTALPRKNLAQSYALSDSAMRGGLTLAQWKTGSIPAPFFETGKVIRYNWKNTNYAHPRDAALNLILEPTKSSSMKADTFIIFLKKVGQGSDAKWKVDYFGAVKGVPVPSD